MFDENIGVYPPNSKWDIAAYPVDDVVEGYRDHSLSDHPPGDNRSPGYKWGWTNARRDMSGKDDGFGGIRSAYIQMERMAN